MSSFNRVILMGNLTRDPETIQAKGGTVIAKFGIALNEKYKDTETTTFVDVTMFGNRAEAFARFHSKGDRTLLEGRLRMDTWDDKNGGGKRSKLYVIADSWQFASDGKSKDKGASRPATRGGAGAGGGGDPWGVRPQFVDETPF